MQTEPDGDIPDYEMYEIAKEVERFGKKAELGAALERSEQVEDTTVRTLLDRWQKEMVAMGIAPRPHLMDHLARMGMKDLHAKSVLTLFLNTPMQLYICTGCCIKSSLLTNTCKS